MSQPIRSRARAIAWVLMLVYFASYTTRINFAVMLVKICSDMNMEKTALAIVLTGLTITYGGGQIISGLLGDKIKAQWMLTFGLGVACIANVAMTFCNTVIPMTLIWCVNGFAQAMLWPPIVRLMSMYLTDREYGYTAVRLYWGSSLSTIMLYLVCPLLLYVMSWRVVMLLCAALGVIVLFVWVTLHSRLFTDPIAVSALNDQDEKPKSLPLPKFVFLPVILIMLGIALQGVLRDGVTNWMPFYLQETFHIPEENAIISTVILAVFSIISFSFFDFLFRKVFQNEVFCAAVIFVGSVVCAGALYLSNLFSASVVISMLLMALIVAFMHGVNLMLITIVPKRFLKSGKVATYSGLFNAFTYIGAAASTYGFAALSEKFGWNFTILTWILVSLGGAIVCLIAAPIWKKFRSEYADV